MKTKQKVELLIAVIFTFLVVLVAPSILKPLSDTGRMIAKPIIYLLLVGMPLIISRLLRNPIGNLGFKRENLLKQILTGVGIFIVVGAVYAAAVFALGDNKTILLDTKKEGALEIAYGVASVILLAGFGEEILFRGYFLGRFQTLVKSGVGAVVITALMFGIWHFPGGQDFLQVIIVSVLGFIYGFSMLKMKNCTTLSVAIAHGLHDTLILILSCILL
jgi:membrane protease YdiL (CAAX protease family)